MASRLQNKADENFELGFAHFRCGELVDARNCFEMVRDIERDRPRGYIADVFVSCKGQDFHRAIVSLLRALERAETLEDLKIEGFIEKLFGGEDVEAQERGFRRVTESLNLFVNSNPDAPRLNMLLAYYAWLNGDLQTAIAAAEIAEKVEMEESAPHVAKFHRLLIEARDGQSIPSRKDEQPALPHEK
ncbi:MAG: hypothetical protein JXQ75_22600 [Phycisphaerae bacterium]|nr:hypothetical protein [Phycisphaerae bacterium]